MITFKNKITQIAIVLALLVPFSALADNALTSFKAFVDVPAQENIVPEVYEVALPINLETKIMGVYDLTDISFEPHYFIENRTKSLVSTQVKTKEGKNLFEVQDKKYSTHASFPARLDGGVVTTSLTITSAAPVNSSAIDLNFDQNVSNPLTVAVTVGEGANEEVIISERSFNSKKITFPETRATIWNITLRHIQPLRITELELIQKDAEQDVYRAVRFLGQPGHVYRIYFDGDRYVNLGSGESSNLRDEKGLIKLSSPIRKINPLYSLPDADSDGVPDSLDNCVRLSNRAQEDIDGNGRGDACDDYDRDGIVNSSDNCVNEPNRGQQDEDGDGIGDVCDGVESRITEKYGWLPWLGIVGVFIALIVLFGVTLRSMRKDKEVSIDESIPQGADGVPQKSDSEENGVDPIADQRDEQNESTIN